MRLTVLHQTAKGLPITFDYDDQTYPLRESTLKIIESVKWYLWHGNTYQTLEHLNTLEMELDTANEQSNDSVTRKLLKAV